MTSEELDLNNSLFLEKCKGCWRNITKKEDFKGCLIYLEGENSRYLEKRKEEGKIKPFETYNNIVKKNKWLKDCKNEEKKDEIYNERIELIDNLILAEEDLVKNIKNSIFEYEREIDGKKKKIFLAIDTIKIKNKINEKGIRKYNYQVIWLIKKIEEIDNKEEIKIIANYESGNENEFKILLRSIILGLLMISNESEVILGVNEQIKKLLYETLNNTSNRRKIDLDFYIELIFIENFLRKNDITLVECNEREYRKVIEFKKSLREMLEDKEIRKNINWSFELIDTALLTNEYNLIWNKIVITGGYRKWRKKVTEAIWKNEILNSEKLEDLFRYNFTKEFDWQTTLAFISNRINFNNRQCSVKDTRDRSYCIKNLLRDLPTYDILNKRSINKIEDGNCKRCDKKVNETWEHVWICEANETTIESIVEEAGFRYESSLKEKNRTNDIKIINFYLYDFLRILQQPSRILLGKSRIWEILRGVYNENFNLLSKDKNDNEIIKEFWRFIYDEMKKRIWIPRCEEIKRLEEREGIKKSDLKKKRKMSSDEEDDNLDDGRKKKTIKNKKTQENVEKIEKNSFNNKIKVVTLNRIIGKIADRINIKNNWDLTIKAFNF